MKDPYSENYGIEEINLKSYEQIEGYKKNKQKDIFVID